MSHDSELARARELLDAFRLDDAEAICHRLLAGRGDDVRALLLLAAIARQRGAAPQEWNCLGEVLRLEPLHREAALRYSRLAMTANRADVARNCLAGLLDAKRTDAEVAELYADACAQAGDWTRAASAYQCLLDGGEPGAALLYKTALAQTHLGAGAAAAQNYERALALDPAHHDARLGRAALASAAGDFERARGLLAEVIAARPQATEVYRLLAMTKRYATRDDPDLVAMREIAAGGGLDTRQQAQLAFARGKGYDDCGEYAEAFEQFAAANRLSASLLPRYDRAQQEAFDAQLIASFDAQLVAKLRLRTDAAPRPIFIVGMPRAGTTLVEQVLASHSGVSGGGEIDTLAQTALTALAPFPVSLGRETGTRLRAVRETYLRRLSACAGGAAAVTDKLPANFLFVGLIFLLFPNAAVIDVRRDPRDNALSIFFQDFKHLNLYALDLDDIVHYAGEYRRTMRHWGSLFGDAVHRVRYEDLVADPEGETRALLRHCDLAWEDDCLAPHRSRRMVTTLSSWQVRQPVYRRSVARWRHYSQQAATLLAAYGDADEPRLPA